MMIFCESFDHLTTQAQLVSKGYTQIGSGTPSFVTGRTGNNAYRLKGAAGTGQGIHPDLRKGLGGNKSTIITGFAFRAEGINFTTDQPICRLLDNGTIQTDLRFTPGRFLRITRNGTSLALGSTFLATDIWHYLELRVTIASSGSYELRINGAVELSGTANTQATANAYANQVSICSGASFGASDIIAYQDFDDWYVLDTTGSFNNDFLSDVAVRALLPNGNGNSSQWVGSDGNSTDNYLLVDETSPNDNTDYVESSTVGHKDTYAYANLTSTDGSVHAVQFAPRAIKTDGGLRKIKGVARLSGTELDSPEMSPPGGTYGYPTAILEEKPGGGQWTATNVNDAEFGIKVSA